MGLKNGDKIICEVCGREFKYVWRGNTKYCSEKCGYVADKKRNTDQYAKVRNQMNIERRTKDAKRKKCLSITEVAVLARAEGMTYGEYVKTHNV